jgi:hypothetical protein
VDTPVAILDYVTPEGPGRLCIEPGPDGGVTITVPTRRSAGRIAVAVASTDLFAFIFVPFALIAFYLFRTRKPRAVLRMTREHLSISETDDNGLGWSVQRRSWPLAEIGELRRNRFQNSLWITIKGRDCLDLLHDLPANELLAIIAALSEARQRLLG